MFVRQDVPEALPFARTREVLKSCADVLPTEELERATVGRSGVEERKNRSLCGATLGDVGFRRPGDER